jgi:hypothetical protein
VLRALLPTQTPCVRLLPTHTTYVLCVFQIAMCELGVRTDKVRARVLVRQSSHCRLQVLYHGNLKTQRDMTDVADSSKVMVDLMEVRNRHCHGLLINLLVDIPFGH